MLREQRYELVFEDAFDEDASDVQNYYSRTVQRQRDRSKDGHKDKGYNKTHSKWVEDVERNSVMRKRFDSKGKDLKNTADEWNQTMVRANKKRENKRSRE